MPFLLTNQKQLLKSQQQADFLTNHKINYFFGFYELLVVLLQLAHIKHNKVRIMCIYF